METELGKAREEAFAVTDSLYKSSQDFRILRDLLKDTGSSIKEVILPDTART
jgi:hypothetical protein